MPEFRRWCQGRRPGHRRGKPRRCGAPRTGGICFCSSARAPAPRCPLTDSCSPPPPLRPHRSAVGPSFFPFFPAKPPPLHTPWPPWKPPPSRSRTTRSATPWTSRPGPSPSRSCRCVWGVRAIGSVLRVAPRCRLTRALVRPATGRVRGVLDLADLRSGGRARAGGLSVPWPPRIRASCPRGRPKNASKRRARIAGPVRRPRPAPPAPPTPRGQVGWLGLPEPVEWLG